MWWIECKISGAGEWVTGKLADAIAKAKSLCSDDGVRWCVWAESPNVKVAEVDYRRVWMTYPMP